MIFYPTMERLGAKKAPLYDTFHHYHTRDAAYIYNDYTTHQQPGSMGDFITVPLRFGMQGVLPLLCVCVCVCV